MKIKIIIEFDPQSHSIQVAAPHDKILSYGMLEMAKQVIANQEEKKEPIHGRKRTKGLCGTQLRINESTRQRTNELLGSTTQLLQYSTTQILQP